MSWGFPGFSVAVSGVRNSFSVLLMITTVTSTTTLTATLGLYHVLSCGLGFQPGVTQFHQKFCTLVNILQVLLK